VSAPGFVPLSGRVLLEPMEPDRTTDAGLILVEDRKPETMGRVVAVAARPLADIRAAVTEKLGAATAPEAVSAYEAVLDLLAEPESAVQVGDVVLFSWVSGQEILLDNARYLIMPESDILAVVEGA